MTKNGIASFASFLVTILCLWIPSQSFVLKPVSFQRNFVSTLAGTDTSAAAAAESVQEAINQDADLYASLKDRIERVEKGIGKRYRVRTQIGFLNVHSTFEQGPHAVHNVVGILEEGQIVRAVAPRIDDWIKHDAGGWSIAEFGGFTWLEPLEDDEH